MVAIRFLGPRVQVSKSEKGAAWLMECRRPRARMDGPKGWAVPCGNRRIVLAKRLGKVLACVPCSAEKMKAGRAKGGRTYGPPKPGKGGRIRATPRNYLTLILIFHLEAALGDPRRLDDFLTFFRADRRGQRIRRPSPENLLGAVGATLMEYPLERNPKR